MYFMRGKLCKEEVNVAYDNSNLELWHKRLTYLSEKGLQIIARKDILTKIKSKALEPCLDCLSRKQHGVAFHKNVPPTTRKHIFDLVHSDICSMIEKSLGGALYFVTFIDDHSRKVWVSLLKTKDQVLEAFKEFQAKVERETERKLNCVRADNGVEYRGLFE